MYNLSIRAEWNNDNFEKKKVKIMKNYFINNKNDSENPHEPNNNELPNEKPVQIS